MHKMFVQRSGLTSAGSFVTSTFAQRATLSFSLKSSTTHFAVEEQQSFFYRSKHEISVPSWENYKRATTSSGSNGGRAFTYMMIGSGGFGYALGAKNLVTELIDTMNPAANVRALANIEVDIGSIAPGNSITVKWRGKPLFIRHRTDKEIQAALQVNMKELRDPEEDEKRRKKPEWLILLGVCTHLGCVPVGGLGEYGGWFCPCHGSHYDTSGRIRKGPAPLNLEVPPYVFMDDSKVLVGKSTLDD